MERNDKEYFKNLLKNNMSSFLNTYSIHDLIEVLYEVLEEYNKRNALINKEEK